MSLFLVSFAVFSLVMVGMAVGVIVNNREIKGSCGGLNDIDGLKGACDICEGKKICRRRRQQERKALSRSPLQSARRAETGATLEKD